MSFFNHWFSGPPLESSRLPPQDTLKESYKKIEEIQNSAANFKVPTSEKLPWEQHGVFSYFDSPQEKLEWQIKKYKKLLGLDPLKDEWIRAPNNTLFKRTWGGLQNSAVKEQIEGHLASKLLDLEVNLKKMKKEKEFKEQFKEFLTGYAPDIEYEKCHWVKKPAKPLVQSIKRNDKNPRAFTSHVSTGQDDFFERSLVSKYPGSVGEFVRNEDDVKTKTSIFLKKLEMSIPKNDQEAALFYKYIVKGKTPNWDYFYYLPYIPPETSPNALDTTSDKYVDLAENREPDMYDPSRKVTEDSLKKVSVNTQQSTENLVDINQGVSRTNENLADLNDQVDDTNTELKSVSSGVTKLGKVIAEKNFQKKTPITSPKLSPEIKIPQGTPSPPQKTNIENKPSPEPTPLKSAPTNKMIYNDIMKKSKEPLTELEKNEIASTIARIKNSLTEDEYFAYLDAFHSEKPESIAKSSPVSSEFDMSEDVLNARLHFDTLYDVTKKREDMTKTELDRINKMVVTNKSKLTEQQQIDWDNLMKEKNKDIPVITTTTTTMTSTPKSKPKPTQNLFGITPEKQKTKSTFIITPFEAKKIVEKVLSPEKQYSPDKELEEQALKEKEILDLINMKNNRNFEPLDEQKKTAIKKYENFIRKRLAKKGQSPDTLHNNLVQIVDRFKQRVDRRAEKALKNYVNELEAVKNDTRKLMKAINTDEKAKVVHDNLFKNIDPLYTLEWHNMNNKTDSKTILIEPDLEYYDHYIQKLSGPHLKIHEDLKKLENSSLSQKEKNTILGDISDQVIAMLNKTKFKAKESPDNYIFTTGLILGKLVKDPNISKEYLGLILNSNPERLTKFRESLFQNYHRTVKIPID